MAAETFRHAAIISIKGRPGEERHVESLLKEIMQGTAECEGCSFDKKNERACRLVKVDWLSTSAGRFDYVMVVKTQNTVPIHDLVLKCLRRQLGEKVLDTETTLTYNLEV